MGCISRSVNVKEAIVQDVVYVAVLFAFFALAALFVVGCDRIIGPDEVELADAAPSGDPEPESQELAA